MGVSGIRRIPCQQSLIGTRACLHFKKAIILSPNVSLDRIAADDRRTFAANDISGQMINGSLGVIALLLFCDSWDYNEKMRYLQKQT